MDPYRTLGVPRGCTREEVKAAFRARVPLAHPDRGGEDGTFIQLRAAYEQILAELDRRPPLSSDINRSGRASRHDGNARPRGPARNHDRSATRSRRARAAHPQTPRSGGQPASLLRHPASRFGQVCARQPTRLVRLLRLLAIVFLLNFMLSFPFIIGVGVIAWGFELEKHAAISGHSEFVGLVLGGTLILGPLLSACWLVWRFGSR